MTTTVTAFERARLYVSAIPGAVSGAGGHDQTFAVACSLVHGFSLSEREALDLLGEYNERCAPLWSEKELLHKLRSALLASHNKPRGYLLGCKEYRLNRGRMPIRFSIAHKPQIDPATATENYLKGFRCDESDLWESSPVRLPDDWTKDALAVLAFLFEPSEQINFVTAFSVDKHGKAKPEGKGETIERNVLMSRWRRGGTPGSDAGAWVRMNPLSGCGVCDANVTAFRFALVECDKIPTNLQLSLLVRLPIPIAAVITSGGRSVHAWVKVAAQSAQDYKRTVSRMLALLAKFGVDGKNKNPSRLARLPGVCRRIGATGDGRQRLLYLNPDPTQRAVL